MGRLLIDLFRFVTFLFFFSLLALSRRHEQCVSVEQTFGTLFLECAVPKSKKPKYIEAIVSDDKHKMLAFVRSQRGAPFLVESGHVYRCERHNEQRTYWLCTKYKTVKCGGRLICQGNDIVKYTPHTHHGDMTRTSRSVVEYRDMTSPDMDLFLRAFVKWSNNWLWSIEFYAWFACIAKHTYLLTRIVVRLRRKIKFTDNN